MIKAVNLKRIKKIMPIIILLLIAICFGYKTKQCTIGMQKIYNNDIEIYVGKCSLYKQSERFFVKPGHKVVDCFFYLSNGLQLHLYGGTFGTKLTILDKIDEAVQENAIYQYVEVDAFGHREYWLVSMSNNGEELVSIDGSATYFSNGIKIYCFGWVVNLTLAICVAVTSFGRPVQRWAKNSYKAYHRKRRKIEREREAGRNKEI